MIVKIQIIINVDPQKFNTVCISYGEARDLNFQIFLRAHVLTIFSTFEKVIVMKVIVMKPSKSSSGVFLKLKNGRIKVRWTGDGLKFLPSTWLF